MNQFALAQSRVRASLVGMEPEDARYYAKLSATLDAFQANLDRHRVDWEARNAR